MRGRPLLGRRGRLGKQLARAGLATGLLAFAACGGVAPPPAVEEIPTAQQLYERGQQELRGHRTLLFFHTVDYERAIETFQSIIDNYPYSEQAVLAELAIADAYFEQGRYEEALSYYRDFADLHPEHERVPYTIYRAALCHERESKGPGRDQTETRKALETLERLREEDGASPFAAEAAELRRKLRRRLAQHALQVGDFYLERGEYPSAAERYRSVLKEFPGVGLDAKALYKLGLCYAKMRRQEKARQAFETLLESFPESEYARDAERFVTKTP